MAEDDISKKDGNLALTDDAEFLPEDQDVLTRQIEQILDIASPDKKHELATSITKIVEKRVIAERFRGPLPHPRHLALYEQILPGSASNILSSMNKEQEHRHHMERATLALQTTISHRQLDYQDRGQWIGSLICFMFMMIGCWLAYIGHDLAACTFVGTAAVGIVAIFVRGHIQSKSTDDSPDNIPDRSEDS